METNFNFKSQICTYKNQSERLLALGLRKETADMAWLRGHEKPVVLSNTFNDKEYGCIPAWSLGRLIEIVCNGQTLKGDICSDIIFDEVIDCIEHEIKEGHFNKEYLV